MQLAFTCLWNILFLGRKVNGLENNRDKWSHRAEYLLKRFCKHSRYLGKLLEAQFRLFRGAVDPFFLIMDDNPRPHRAYVGSEYMQTKEITRMDWPP